MLTKLRRIRSAAAARSAAGIIQINLTPPIRSVLDQLGARLSCDAEVAAERAHKRRSRGERKTYR